MDNLSITRSTIDGLKVAQVNTGVLSLALMPELGGKIRSLRDLRTGREWLWRHPRLPYRRAAPGASYVAEADTGGWDECFPTVAPCQYPSAPWSGAALPDHGELWSQAAALEVEVGQDCVCLRARWQGSALPYSFERHVRLTAGSGCVRADYSVCNHGGEPLQFIWSIHPLLRIEPGMRLRLPPQARFNRWASAPDDALPADSGLIFPLKMGDVDLATLPDASAGVALKLWSDPLAEGQGWASLEARDGELAMRWDPAALPQVGFWLNLGAWAGDGGAPYFNLGLEPCIGAQDSLAEAVLRHQLFATLPPGGSRAWWLEVELKA
jgi:hypothetical protein